MQTSTTFWHGVFAQEEFVYWWNKVEKEELLKAENKNSPSACEWCGIVALLANQKQSLKGAVVVHSSFHMCSLPAFTVSEQFSFDEGLVADHRSLSVMQQVAQGSLFWHLCSAENSVPVSRAIRLIVKRVSRSSYTFDRWKLGGKWIF